MSKNDFITNVETVRLPSEGLVYSKPINPELELRPMTTQEEMLRLAPTQTPQKRLCDIIENCIVGEKPSISVYDMCLGDYYYLLHRLRVITYGNNYKMLATCPFCNSIFETTVNLGELKINKYHEELGDILKVHLPRIDKDVELYFRTPRMLDEIDQKKKEMLKNSDGALDPTILITLSKCIATFNGVALSPIQQETLPRNLQLLDAKMILNHLSKFDESIGPEPLLEIKCENKQCGRDIIVPFQYNSGFIDPVIY
jgi:hypothetical protein